MARLPSYDAMRDPHCRYTQKKQFRRHHNKYKEVQMMSEILRGDHAGLNDIVTPSKLSPLPKPDLPGISQKNQHSGKKKSPLLKMQHLQRTYESPSHLSKRHSYKKAASKIKKSSIGPRGPNGEDSRGLPSYGSPFNQKPPILPALSPQSLNQLKAPEVYRENQDWQRQRNQNLNQEVEDFEEWTSENKRKMKNVHSANLKDEETQGSQEKRRWKKKMEMEAGRINLQAMSHYLEPLTSANNTTPRRSPFAQKMPLPSRPSGKRSSHHQSLSKRPIHKGKTTRVSNDDPNDDPQDDTFDTMIDSPENRRRIAANLKRPEAAETSSTTTRGAFSGLLIARDENHGFLIRMMTQL